MTERSAVLILTSARGWDGTERVGHDAVAIGQGRIMATGSIRSIIGLSAEKTSTWMSPAAQSCRG